jgi:membrane protein DedA with SNARE-associated domain
MVPSLAFRPVLPTLRLSPSRGDCKDRAIHEMLAPADRVATGAPDKVEDRVQVHFHDLQHLVASYGYWAVMIVVALESFGVPLPGETVLLAAAIYCGTTHELDVTLVIAAASVGAAVGGSGGYWLGRQFGYELLLRYGRYIHLDQTKMKLGMYLFLRHGGTVVFFGRFVAFLRAFASLLAGINQMQWGRFSIFNATGAVAWATVFGLGGYFFGKEAHRLLSVVGLIILVIVVALCVIGFVIFRRNHARLVAAAEEAFPGPLHHHIGRNRE